MSHHLPVATGSHSNRNGSEWRVANSECRCVVTDSHSDGEIFGAPIRRNELGVTERERRILAADADERMA
ncbi:MAG: hypothetical protein ACO2PK_03010 [Armatimonadota bacterium]